LMIALLVCCGAASVDADQDAKYGIGEDDAVLTRGLHHGLLKEANNIPKDSHVYLKKGSRLEKYGSKNLKLLSKSGFHRLQILKRQLANSKDTHTKNELSQKIKKLENKVSITQGTYYHKSGSVPKDVLKTSELHLKRVAREAVKSKKQHTHTKHSQQMQAGLARYKRALTKAAVQAVVGKHAELSHKKAAAANLKKSQRVVAAKASQKSLDAEVRAAKVAAKFVEGERQQHHKSGH